MPRMARKMVCLLVLALLAGGMWSVAVAQEASDLSGTVTVTATSVAAGIGWSWGSGTLTLLDGSEHRFKVGGLDVVAVGIKQATGVGNVYNLKKFEDFEGKYVKAAAGIARAIQFSNSMPTRASAFAGWAAMRRQAFAMFV